MLCGWLSPVGSFYPCGPYGHVELANELTRAHYSGLSSPLCEDDFLLQKQWMKLFCDGIVIGDFFHFNLSKPARLITDEQIHFISGQHCRLSRKQERCLSMYLEAEELL